MMGVTAQSVEEIDASTVARSLLELAQGAVAARGRFTVVLAGGRTPRTVYLAVERLGVEGGTEWDRWTVLLSDERCVPDVDEGRNDAVLIRALPSLAAAGRILSVPVELGPERAASGYASIVGDSGPIDLALLGLGADGHTASLFPARARAGDGEGRDRVDVDCMAVLDAPGQFPNRVTLTERALARAAAVWFLVDAVDHAKDSAIADLMRGVGVCARISSGAERRILRLRARPADGDEQ